MELFPEENFGGTPDKFEDGTVKHLVLNTKYKSVKRGQDLGLLVWSEAHNLEIWRWNNDMASFQGTQKLYESFQVFNTGPKPTFIISVRFKDATGAAPGRYLLTVKAADIGNVDLHSNKVDTFSPIGTMPFDGKDVTTAIYVRDTQTGIYVAQGSIYFGKIKWENNVEIRDDTGFPKQLRHERSGISDFDITLVSIAE
jgi:hypothetical protein